MGRWFEHVGTRADGGLPIVHPAEVARHNRVDDCWVIFKGAVYDLTDFVLDHPGGEDLILQYAGHNVAHVMDDPVQHSHSNSAYLLLEEFQIARMPDGYVETPQAPAPPPTAPIAGRAAGAIYADSNSAGPTPSLAVSPPASAPSLFKPGDDELLAPPQNTPPVLSRSPIPRTSPPPPLPPRTPPPPPAAAQPAPAFRRMASSSFSLGSSTHKYKADRLSTKDSSSSLNFLGYRFHRRK